MIIRQNPGQPDINKRAEFRNFQRLIFYLKVEKCWNDGTND